MMVGLDPHDFTTQADRAFRAVSPGHSGSWLMWPETAVSA